ncbi:MAG: hypothetical protein JWM68_278, partial [Verrucomicrobiales bacterium]|nr:hypothetical protein [Verrucomicrobiales bacterium]
MNTTMISSAWKNSKNRFLSTTLLVAICGAATALYLTAAPKDDTGFVAHEWGTFTSLQGGDGQPLQWLPNETAELPKFVYDWQKPGNDRVSTFGSGIKSMFMARQRMETPVIYFYANKTQDVDVTVKFPRGHITEWFPQARTIGPSRKANDLPIASMIARPAAATHVALSMQPGIQTSRNTNDAVSDSLIRWTAEIIPSFKKGVAELMPFEKSSSHYFAARETDAAFVRVSASNSAEVEKFLFYRGVGNFTTPLKVTATNDAVTIANTGKEPLRHLFLLKVHEGAGKFIYVDKLEAHEQKSISIDNQSEMSPIGKISSSIAAKMEKSLESEHLYQREAAAMVKTWDKSWFEEEGLRVFYVLPRNWTDQTLPLALQPAPRDLVRVMVGRAEIISPSLEKQLVQQLTKAKQGDTAARKEAHDSLKRYGRFADPIFYHAAGKISTNVAGMNLSKLHLQKLP